MSRLTTEQFQNHFQFDGETIVLSPNIAMIASLIGHEFDTSFKPFGESDSQEYTTAMIDIVENEKYPGVRAKHEFNWLKSALKFSHILIAKLPHKILSQVSQIKDAAIETATVYDDCAILKFKKSNDLVNTVVHYGNDVVLIDSKVIPILSQNNSQHYSYFKSVSDQNAFDYISLAGNGKKTCREQFNNRVNWNPERVICVSTGADNRKVDNGLNFYSFDEIADINRAVDCYYIPEHVNYQDVVNTLNSQKFLSFLSSVCYNNYQTFNKNFKKKVFNQDIIKFCNEE
jgi:hypothetical protein